MKTQLSPTLFGEALNQREYHGGAVVRRDATCAALARLNKGCCDVSATEGLKEKEKARGIRSESEARGGSSRL